MARDQQRARPAPIDPPNARFAQVLAHPAKPAAPATGTPAISAGSPVSAQILPRQRGRRRLDVAAAKASATSANAVTPDDVFGLLEQLKPPPSSTPCSD
jgi:hypothetical protein